MSSYLVFRYFTPIILMVGWVFYQLLIKKKHWKDVKDAAFVCGIFAVVWAGLAYVLTN